MKWIHVSQYTTYPVLCSIRVSTYYHASAIQYYVQKY
jgi:hypothetical protein